MKRRLKRLLALVALGVMAWGSASANSWGLKGGLLHVMESTRDWDDYTALGEIRTNADAAVPTCYSDVAVMHSRYHNILMVTATGEDDKTHFLVEGVTTAVYQPEDGRDKELRLSAVGPDGFSVSWDGETYVYLLGDAVHTRYDRMQLVRAQMGDFHLESDGSPYGESALRGVDGTGSALWTRSWDLNEDRGVAVNVRLMPRSAAEIRHLNRVTNILCNWACLASPAERTYVPGRKGGATVPVYAAPDENAWRAAKGKAAMSLQGGYTVLGADGEWTVVSYQVSQRTSRVGYVRSSLLGQATNAPDPFVHVPGVTLRATYLTDDPEVSQFHQAELAAGESLTLLGWFSPFYAYAETTVDGKAFRGFVPLRDVDVPLSEPDAAMMAKAVGAWAFDAGGGFAPAEYMILNADGTFAGSSRADFLRGESAPEVTGRWSIHAYDPAWGRFWAEPDVQMLYQMDHGPVGCGGLTLTDTELSLTDEEGGGSFRRVENPETLPDDEEDTPTGGANG